MAWTSVGFDGTITELEWSSKMAGLLGNGYVAAGNGDCLVTAVAGARSVSVAAGSLYGDGVVSTNSAPETVAMTTPVNGQWYVIALRRTWASNTAALVAIAGATTTTTTPTAPPTSFPTLNTTPGVLTDQPIAWAWCNSANTTVVVYDIRLKAVKSLPPVVATSAERDAKFMSPTQGLQVWRDDLGAVETYYGLYNSSTNPGGRDTAGWYANDRQTGLRPIQVPTVVVASGSATVNAMGVISVSGASVVELRGCFSSQYRNYRMIVQGSHTASTESRLRLMSGTTTSTSNYQFSGYYAVPTTTGAFMGSSGDSQIEISWNNTNQGGSVLDIINPYVAKNTHIFGTHATLGGSSQHRNATHAIDASYDGLYIFDSTGTFTGTIQLFGYNS